MGITGRIEQGFLKPNDQVKFAPQSGVAGKCFSIEMHHKNVEEAGAGDNVGVNVKGLDKLKMPKCGDVMFLQDDSDPPTSVAQFTAMCFVQDHPGQLKCSKDGKGGFTPSIHVRTAKAPCQLVEIKWKQGKSTGNQKVPNPPYDQCKPLARIAAMDSNSLVMLGKVTAVVAK